VGKTRKSLVSTLKSQNLEFGYHADKEQPGLYLQIARGKKGPTKSWVFRYTSPVTGKRREMGLGSYRDRTLIEARAKAYEYRKQLLDGIDPITAKASTRSLQKAQHRAQVSFETAALQCIETKRYEWTNPKHTAQWTNTLRTYAFPAIGQRLVKDITNHDLLAVLQPIWLTKTETASRVRQRIETIIDWAKAHGQFEGENPARLDGPLGQLLPKAGKIKRVEHFAALPFEQLSNFMGVLRAKQSVTALALEFLILTASRTGEVIGAHQNEVDFGSKTWTIPASRMKARREHRAPLTDRCLEIILCVADPSNTDGWLFPSPWSKFNRHRWSILDRRQHS
jgi:integrase